MELGAQTSQYHLLTPLFRMECGEKHMSAFLMPDKTGLHSCTPGTRSQAIIFAL